MADNGSKGDAALLVALASGATVRDAANRAGVAERTVYRRLDNPAFQRRLASTRAELMGRAVGQLADASTAAVRTLRRLLKADGESVRLGAARSILELGARLREAVELDGRLADLESQVEGLVDRRQQRRDNDGQKYRATVAIRGTGGRGADGER